MTIRNIAGTLSEFLEFIDQWQIIHHNDQITSLRINIEELNDDNTEDEQQNQIKLCSDLFKNAKSIEYLRIDCEISTFNSHLIIPPNLETFAFGSAYHLESAQYLDFSLCVDSLMIICVLFDDTDPTCLLDRLSAFDLRRLKYVQFTCPDCSTYTLLLQNLNERDKNDRTCQWLNKKGFPLRFRWDTSHFTDNQIEMINGIQSKWSIKIDIRNL